MKNIIFYHGDLDGIASAAIVRKFLGEEESECIKCNYDNGVDTSIIDSDTVVWIVDFSFEQIIMQEINDKAKKVFWFDHHQTAKKIILRMLNKTTVVLDMDQAGCGITWSQLFHDKHMPLAIEYTQDRDLWLFKNCNTEAFCECANMSIDGPEDVSWFNLLTEDEELQQTVTADFCAKGNLLIKARRVRVDRAMKKGKYGKIHGHKAFFVNTTTDISEVGKRIYMSHEEPIVAVMYQHIHGGKLLVSLRSNQINVREIAEKHGGGGHDYAAGFKLDEQLDHFCESVKNFWKDLGRNDE